MFVPFGMLAPLRWPRFDSAIGVIVASATFSIAIESLQFALPTGRQTSVTDVIMNVTGALIGYASVVFVRTGLLLIGNGRPGELRPPDRRHHARAKRRLPARADGSR